VSVYAPLSGQICQDLDELEYLVVQTTRLAQKAKATGDDDYLGTVALNLHGFIPVQSESLRNHQRSR